MRPFPFASYVNSFSFPLPASYDVLRAYQLAFIRLGPPGPEIRARALARLDPLYPSGRFAFDRELALLVERYLKP